MSSKTMLDVNEAIDGTELWKTKDVAAVLITFCVNLDGPCSARVLHPDMRLQKDRVETLFSASRSSKTFHGLLK
jgi:hypothetical protein